MGEITIDDDGKTSVKFDEEDQMILHPRKYWKDLRFWVQLGMLICFIFFVYYVASVRDVCQKDYEACRSCPNPDLINGSLGNGSYGSQLYFPPPNT